MAPPMTQPMAEPDLVDPLAAFLGRHGWRSKAVPLAETRLVVTLAAGLAVVETTRLFRNTEAQPIEATITFPVPIHATLFRLTARIDGRTLEGRAQRRAQARDTYEAALDRGKAAVLHEEVLRGLHMLSVGQVPPGAEVEVRFAWAMPMEIDGGTARLRIPMTIGDIYGPAPLPDSDAPLSGGPGGTARLTLRCQDGIATLDGAPIGAETEVPLNRPVELSVTGWAPRLLVGSAAAATRVGLRIVPLPAAPARRNLAILVDRSGSMFGPCGQRGALITRHAAVRQALSALAPTLAPGDALELWEFDDEPRRLGTTRRAKDGPAAALTRLVAGMQAPGGGTEIGRALSRVLARSTMRDILVLTDGNSHALDVPGLAHRAAGRRISLLLVGEDSLEARIGHLAALTGGSITVAAHDLPSALPRALAALEAARAPLPPGALAVRGQAAIEVTPAPEAAPEPDPLLSRAIAAVAAGLRLATLAPEEAAALAEPEGLVTTETSLVLVDEAGEAHHGVSATRRVALPAPAMAPTAAFFPSSEPRMAKYALSLSEDRYDDCGPPDSAKSLSQPRIETPPDPRRHLLQQLVAEMRAQLDPVDWNLAPAALEHGDLACLPDHEQSVLLEFAGTAFVLALAREVGISSVRLVVGLLAALHAGQDRTAARLARALLPPELRAECGMAG